MLYQTKNYTSHSRMLFFVLFFKDVTLIKNRVEYTKKVKKAIQYNTTPLQ